jgi:hypothetical protein
LLVSQDAVSKRPAARYGEQKRSAHWLDPAGASEYHAHGAGADELGNLVALCQAHHKVVDGLLGVHKSDTYTETGR